MYRATFMFSMHHNRQMTVASVLLLLLAAFAVDPPDHRCRTQSTRNRQSRIVRLDDSESHTRWHNHGSDNSGHENRDAAFIAIVDHLSAPRLEFAVERIVPEQEGVRPFSHRIGAIRSRPPPSTNLA